LAATVVSVFVLICLLQIKHMFADYFLQTPKMLSGRGEYLHVGRAQHAGIHALGSALVLLVMGAGLPFLLIVVLVEWFVHFNIDWGKAKLSDSLGYGPDQAGYWRLAGLDQALHQLTYVAMTLVWYVTYATPA
jgi:hypothetical protein